MFLFRFRVKTLTGAFRNGSSSDGRYGSYYLSTISLLRSTSNDLGIIRFISIDFFSKHHGTNENNNKSTECTNVGARAYSIFHLGRGIR